MSRWVSIVLSLCLGMPASAAVLEGVGAPARTFDESGVKVPVYAEVTPKLPGLPVGKLYLTGAGLREKKIALFHVNVYIAASYIDHAGGLPAGAPMDGIQKSKVNALQLTFLRNLSAEQVRGAFVESLKKNGSDVTSPAIQGILSKLDSEMPKGSTLTLFGIEHAARQTLSIETPTGAVVTGDGPNLATQFWRIWFGEPADGGLEDLKAMLVGGKS